MGSLSSSSLAENLVCFLDGCLRERENERLVVRANGCLGWKEIKAGLVFRGNEERERRREAMARELRGEGADVEEECMENPLID